MDWKLYLNFFAAMIAIVNPLGIVPLWSQLTEDVTKQVRRDIAYMITITAAFILLLFMNTGQYILEFFSIDLPVFQIAGGILLLFTGISMVNGQASRLERKDEPGETPYQIAKSRFRKIVVPLAIPMLSGPGSLTTVLLYGARAESLADYISLSALLLITLGILLVLFMYSGKIEKKIDPIVFNVVTRLLGVIVVAIAVQFIVEGLGDIFPNWMEGASAMEKEGTQTK